jgi:hypothetical protein
MARALTAEWLRVDPSARAAARQEWTERRTAVTAAGARYWVFSSAADDTAFLEFIEARDAETLANARSRAGLSDGAAILTEVELS